MRGSQRQSRQADAPRRQADRLTQVGQHVLQERWKIALAREAIAVTRFTVGDRVIVLAVGSDKDANTGAEGAFQQYSVVLERVAAPIPNGMSFEDASVLPLAVSTAASGLFQKDQLGLQLPSLTAKP